MRQNKNRNKGVIFRSLHVFPELFLKGRRRDRNLATSRPQGSVEAPAARRVSGLTLT